MKTFVRFMIVPGLIAAMGCSQRVSSQGVAGTNASNAPAATRLWLDEVLSSKINTLATAPDKTWNYVPNDTGLGTNSAVWTWPLNLSCVGIASDYYQCALITPDKLLTCAHYGGEKGQSVRFKDTNGIVWTGYVSNVVNVLGDLCISHLSNSAPASIVMPAIFPPEVTNYLPNHSFAGLPAFWVHRNGNKVAYHGTIQYDPVVQVADYNAMGGIGTWMRVAHNGYGRFGNGASATGGDSGSPAFMMLSNTPVLLFAATMPGDAAGMFVSSARNFAALAAGGHTNGMNILNLQGFKKYP